MLRKGKGEKERYKHLNAEFQRIARRDKKDFFSNQCKETEENNRMGKTRDLFKKIRATKRTFLFFFFKFYFIFKLYIIVLVLPNIKMNPSQVYMC